MQKVDYLPSKRIKAFKNRPVIQFILNNEPTDRFILWIISHDPTAFNPLYHGQFVTANIALAQEGGALFKALKTVQSLQVRKLIKQDRNMNWGITFWGYLFRVRTHSLYSLIPLFALIISVVAFIRTCMPAHQKEGQELKATYPNTDSAQYRPAQIAPLLKKDSFALQLHKIKKP